ncbi:thioredoxin family protein [Hyunsoonleella pacifica]|uniref:DUF255 domain-containing protein n=1 Tax=Hyunsoonleella pacifica TaxID=1080224 RepID=A0A4V2JB24_9FLAO|nr:thioredoxin family protein [Hyunsoonleella pacifica]TBN16553.1 DUF255 domain-containing protein [Hyunsoonleella pacifica]GGD18491.1 hypothetical protein GCM10011368_20460 [Hyunsoonleella pacifica]
MKYFVCLILLSVSLSAVSAQTNSGINWMSWAQLEQALNKEPKPVFVYFHSEWCAYCKKIKRKVFTNPEVIQKLNTDYYAVEMDVESKDTIVFDGVIFTNKQATKKRNGVHELPLLLASRENKAFTLPATLFFENAFNIRERVFKYYTSKQLLNKL